MGYRKYPQVLLLGNGLNRAYETTAVSWKELIRSVEEGPELPEKMDIPMPLEAVLRTRDRIDETLRKQCAGLYGRVEEEKMQLALQKLLSMGFDHILTTNYSYELEAAALSQPEMTEKQIRKSMRHTDEISKAESKYLLHTYNEVSCQGHVNKIWHIHGEARKPDSMILGHYYYGNLLYKYQELLKKRANSYQHNQKIKREQKIGSWLDAFILGDVYILGFGMDFSEMDMWWLLNRKKREKADKGKVYYYSPEPKEFDVKTEMLKVYDVSVKHLGCLETEESFDYPGFYQKAIDDMAKRMR